VTDSKINVLATIRTLAFDETPLVAKYSATRPFTSSPNPAADEANVTLALLRLTGRAVDRDLRAWG
jgi:hypothetical protein